MDNVRDNVPAYQFNVIPGNANQGAILLTRKDITNPPFNQDDFIWKAMEDIIGTANVKLEYDEIENKYLIFKAKGHLDNEGNWNYEWELFGTWAALTPEAAETLERLNYVEYIFDTSEANRLKVNGVEKDGQIVELCNLTFASKAEFDSAIETLTTNLTNEISRATNKENQLQSEISAEVTRATNKENQLQSEISAEVTRATNKEQDLQNQIDDNKENLADYRGSFATKAALNAYTGPANNNDYAVVLADETHSNQCWRYIYSGSSSSWIAQYMVNDSPLTQAQLAALNSGINSTKVAQIEQNRQDIANINNEIGGLQEELTPGNGIKITNNVISAKTYNGINLDTNGISVKPGDGITLGSSGVAAKGNTNAGINVTANGIGVKLGTGLSFDTGGNIVPDKVPGSLQLWKIIPIERLNALFSNGLTGGTLEAGVPKSVEEGFEDIAPLFTITNPSEYRYTLDGVVEFRIITPVDTSYTNIETVFQANVGPQMTSRNVTYGLGTSGQQVYSGSTLPLNSRQILYQPNSTNKISFLIISSKNGTVNKASAFTDLRIYAIRI